MHTFSGCMPSSSRFWQKSTASLGSKTRHRPDIIKGFWIFLERACTVFGFPGELGATCILLWPRGGDLRRGSMHRVDALFTDQGILFMVWAWSPSQPKRRNSSLAQKVMRSIPGVDITPCFFSSASPMLRETSMIPSTCTCTCQYAIYGSAVTLFKLQTRI